MKFNLREITQTEAAERWNNRNTHEFLDIDPKYLSGSRRFVCDNNACEGLYFLDSIYEQPENCAYCALSK
ncbi:MAG: hypothetical protein ACRD5B_12415 [Nitrososphaeraceae archaeon]|jgi:hypothetical protein